MGFLRDQLVSGRAARLVLKRTINIIFTSIMYRENKHIWIDRSVVIKTTEGPAGSTK
jgi:hypothetical protein